MNSNETETKAGPAEGSSAMDGELYNDSGAFDRPASSGESETDTKAAKTIAARLKIPYIDLSSARIEPAAASLLRPDTAFQLKVVPVRLVGDILLVAMASPEEQLTIRTLEILTRCKIRPAAAPGKSVAAALQEIYGRVTARGDQDRQDPVIAAQEHAPVTEEKQVHTISVISNKGGVGKTHFSINLACALGRGGARVLLIDADLGNADISNKLALFPKHHLIDFLEKNLPMEDLVVHTNYNFDLICGSFGEFKLANMNHAQKERFIKHFKRVSRDYDFALFDLSAGIGRTVLDFALAADRTVIVTTPQDIISGYACAKAGFMRFKEIEERLEERLSGYTPQLDFSPMLVLNQVGDIDQGVRLYRKIEKTASQNISANEARFQITPEYLGAIPYDKRNFLKAEVKRRPFILELPDIKASRCIRHMSTKFCNKDNTYDPKPGFRNAFSRFAAVFTHRI